MYDNSGSQEEKLIRNDLIKEETICPIKYNLEYSWKDIVVAAKKPINNKAKDNKVSDSKPKLILDNVYGKVQSGEALAILGGSGAGKTTLLNFLSKKMEAKNLKIEGEILLNNQKVDSGVLSSLSSYVMQDDILEATMTPVETLMFTAKLKLSNLSDEEIERRVQNMIIKLNLENAKNTKIGNNLIRGVSGGERKRTSIGVELISDPQIVFLDEPTTGLDSFNAFEVVNNLCKLAKEDNKLIIFTIHQPSSEIFTLLDKVCILADGRTIYFGPQDKCLNCFDGLFKLPCKLNYNPFEHFMEMTTLNCIFNPEVRKSYPHLAISENDSDETKFDAYSQHMAYLSDLFRQNKSNYYEEKNYIEGFSEEIEQIIQEKKESKGFFYQYTALIGRNLIVSHRNNKVLFLKLFQNLFTSLIQAFLYFNLSQNFSGIQDRLGIIFLLITSSIFGASTGSLLIFAEEKKIYLRERSNGLYSVPAYFFAKISHELPLYFLTTNCLLTLIYLLAGLNDTYTYNFYMMNGILQIACFAGCSYSVFLSSLVSDFNALSGLNTVFIIPQMLLSGYFASNDSVVFFFKPVQWISGFKYAYQILTEIEFKDVQPLNCINNPVLPCDPLQERLKFSESMITSIIVLASIGTFFYLCSLIILLIQGKNKK